MDNNIDFKELWAKQRTGNPDTGDLFLKLNKLKQAGLRKIVVSNILLLGTAVFIASTWYNFQTQMLSTKLGIVLMILAITVFLFTYNKLFSDFRKIEINQSSQSYLQSLLTIRSKQQFIQTTMLSLYFVLLSAGIF